MAYKYRLYPSRSQEDSLSTMLETHRRLYNQALEQRKAAYETKGKPVTYGQQSMWMKDRRREDPYLAETNFSSCQATLRRLDKAFNAFFRRVKKGEKPGYPRFKGRNRFDSVEFPAYGDGCKLKGKKVYFQHIGDIKIKLHRLVEGKIKTVSFKREIDKWYVIFTCELPDVEAAPSILPPVGIDLGLKSFLVTSEGESIDPPHFYREAEAKLRRAQRHLARCKKGSNRRKKAVKRVATIHKHITNQRRDFHHKVALDLVNSHGLIACEDLNVKGLARTCLAKSVNDVGWGSFLNMLQYKAEGAGTVLVKVDPRKTTQMCSQCQHIPEVKLTLKDRVYVCEKCGFTADRDYNAALNILRLGLSLQALTGTTVSVA
jgi:putative transposase